MKNRIPTKNENPNGLHGRYVIYKVKPVEGTPYSNGETPYELVEPEPAAEYFVLRLDEGGKDREHIKACRIGVHAYADAIEHHIPQLAADLRERYPLL